MSHPLKGGNIASPETKITTNRCIVASLPPRSNPGMSKKFHEMTQIGRCSRQDRDCGTAWPTGARAAPSGRNVPGLRQVAGRLDRRHRIDFAVAGW